MRIPDRDTAVFTTSAIDLFASALGAFILLVMLLFPYYRNAGTDEAFAQTESITVSGTLTVPLELDVVTGTWKYELPPKLMFTQIDLNIDQFLSDLEQDSFMTSPLPNLHPHKLREQILELRANPKKGVKGISLDSVLGRISFLRLRTGFWVAAQDDLLFYPIPTRDVLEHDHYEWYRSLSQ